MPWLPKMRLTAPAPSRTTHKSKANPTHTSLNIAGYSLVLMGVDNHRDDRARSGDDRHGFSF